MAVAVARFITFTDVVGAGGAVGQASVRARHEALLSDGRRVVIFDDRGWSWSLRSSGDDAVHDPWSSTSRQDIEDAARVVVGPDEPFGHHSQEDMEADHWAHVARVLQQHGVGATARELPGVRHDVVLSQRLLAQLSA
jgi:hypothetical protein